MNYRLLLATAASTLVCLPAAAQQAGRQAGSCAGGSGVYFYANGDRFEGGWENGLQEGFGTYYPAAGEPARVYFSAGKRTG